MNEPRIGILCENLKLGGNQTSAAAISCALSEVGFEVKVILVNPPLEVLSSYGGELLSLNSLPGSSVLARALHSFRRSAALRRIIRRQKIDILYVFLNRRNYLNYCRLPRFCTRIASCRDCGDLQTYPKQYIRMLKHAAAMVFNSRYMRDDLVRRAPKLADKCFAIYNIVDREYIDRRTDEEIEADVLAFCDNHQTIISVGRMCREKNFEALISCFETVVDSVPDAGLLLIGDGDMMEIIRKCAAESPAAEHIRLLGARANPYAYMKRCTAFALPSLSEGFPNVLLEALACDLPVVAANCHSGPNEILYDALGKGENITVCELADYGILTPSFAENTRALAEKEFAKALIRLLNDEEQRLKYQMTARRCVARFSRDAAVSALDDVFAYVNAQTKG